MFIERSLPGTARTEVLPTDTIIRIWINKDRFYHIRVVNNETAILVEHFNAPGGCSFATALQMEPNAFNGIVLK